jgi:N-acetylglucosamine-6-phosphate deacetylase
MSKVAFTASACITAVPVGSNVVLVEDGVITAVGSREQIDIPRECRVVDFGDHVLGPGFVDIHIHGGAGHDVMESDPDALACIERHLVKHGTTAYYPTTVTAAEDPTLRSLEKLADAIEASAASDCSSAVRAAEQRACPMGIHLEGPFISQEKRGVHPPQYIQNGSLDFFDRMWRAARGHVKLMTIAPEIPGAEDVIREAAKRGVVVSLGHSNATLAQARAGIDAGGRHATHTFNAMRPLDHREPGITGAVLNDDRLTADIIADGVHVDPTMVRLFVRAKGLDRAVLITDAISATGMPDGQYRLGGFQVEVRGNVCLADGRLAGSVLTLERAVVNMMRFTGCTLEEAVQLATSNPAAIVGDHRRGNIAVGRAADFVVLTKSGELVRTIIGGREA